MLCNIINNRIKQPSQCCVICGKTYKKRTTLDKHIVTCETPCDFFEANILFKKCRLNFNQKKDDKKNEH